MASGRRGSTSIPLALSAAKGLKARAYAFHSGANRNHRPLRIFLVFPAQAGHAALQSNEFRRVGAPCPPNFCGEISARPERSEAFDSGRTLRCAQGERFRGGHDLSSLRRVGAGCPPCFCSTCICAHAAARYVQIFPSFQNRLILCIITVL